MISLVTVCSILIATAIVIAFGRGYRLDITRTSLKPTGLVSATSDPVGAQVFVDGTLKTATNNSFNIEPGVYTVRIHKEGYLPWQKDIRIQGEIVSQASAFLFPTNPSLSPLTIQGIVGPVLSPDGTKIAYAVPEKGLWYYELSEGPLGRNRDPIRIDQNTMFDYKTAQITWSPDTTQLLVDTRLYTVNKPNVFSDVTATRTQILDDWKSQQKETELQKLAAFKQPIINMATASAAIIAFSPDETKILYEATASATIPQVIVPPLLGTNPTIETRSIVPGKYYVYDSREDKNYFLLDAKELTQQENIHWYPTSRHLLLTLKGKIDVLEYDRTNWVTVYSGPFVDNFVAPWTNGSRIIILTNLNGNTESLPNLYTVNLR